ncbi:hypothetical protein M0805_008320 [Coniferiporia weirii]|nr:hypothetical protein M0805_008320 [Coniferiporia weirii]
MENPGCISLCDLTNSLISSAAGDDSALNTLTLVRDIHSPSNQGRVEVDLQSLTLVCGVPYSQGSPCVGAPSSLRFATALAASARATAAAHSCSSVLAGHTSESDEYGDIGLCINVHSDSIDITNNQTKNARTIITCLGLGALLSTEDSDVKITPVMLTEDTKLPSMFKVSPKDSDVAELVRELQRLRHHFSFNVRCGDGVTVLHFLLGLLQDDSSSCWVGLLGAGTWSD